MNSGGWWGVLFVIGLFVVGGIVSSPTAAQSGDEILAFYRANRQIIIIQQLVGVVLLVPFLAFARALHHQSREQTAGSGRWLLAVALALSAAELGTNVLALALAVTPNLSAATARALTFAADLADATLFVTIAVFSLVASPPQWSWIRRLALVVAGLAAIRAFASPIGITALDAIAPFAFLAYVLVLSTRTILLDRARGA